MGDKQIFLLFSFHWKIFMPKTVKEHISQSIEFSKRTSPQEDNTVLIREYGLLSFGWVPGTQIVVELMVQSCQEVLGHIWRHTRPLGPLLPGNRTATSKIHLYSPLKEDDLVTTNPIFASITSLFLSLLVIKVLHSAQWLGALFHLLDGILTNSWITE